MPLTITIRFDSSPQRQSYRVRFRGASYDNTLNVPRKLFREAGVDAKKESERGRKIAERWAYEKAHEIERAIAPKDGAPAIAAPRMTLSALGKLFEAKNPNDVGVLTRKRHREMTANLVRVLGDPFADDVDDTLALEYRNRRAHECDEATGDPIRNRTIKNELAHLKALVTYGYQWRKETGMRELQLFKLPLIRKQPGFDVHLRDDEIAKVLAADFDHDTARWRLIIAFGLFTMLRVKVLMSFDERWYDEKRKWMTIPAEAMKGAGGLKRELSVPVCDIAAEVIRRARELRRRKSSPYVFGNFKGRPSKWPIKSIRSVCEELKIRYFTAHDLRRTGMTVLEESGVSGTYIARLAGHSTPSATRSHGAESAPRITRSYIGIREDEQLRAAVRHFDVFWEHLLGMNPEITLTCTRDVTRGARGAYRKARPSARSKAKSRENLDENAG